MHNYRLDRALAVYVWADGPFFFYFSFNIAIAVHGQWSSASLTAGNIYHTVRKCKQFAMYSSNFTRKLTTLTLRTIQFIEHGHFPGTSFIFNNMTFAKSCDTDR